MNKIKVLCLPSDQFGVGFYRSLRPHEKLQELYGDEFDVTVMYNPNFSDLSFLDEFDMVHFHKIMGGDTLSVLGYLKSKNKISIIDIDDDFAIPKEHPSYFTSLVNKNDKIIRDNIANADYVTTTTDLFAEYLKPINPNVFVIPNAIDINEKQFQDAIKGYKPSKFIRIGMVLGSSHEADVNLLKGMVNRLSQEVKDKVQFVLCGFDTRGVTTLVNPNTNQIVGKRNIKPTETVYNKYEQILTDNYNIISKEYKNFLDLYIPNSVFPNEENEHYRRCWTKNIHEYANLYSNIDILLAPLFENNFNKVKSQLKIIEAGMLNKAFIGQNYGPYTIDTINLIEKGGNINPKGNSILVDGKNNHSDWAKYITKIVKEPHLIEIIKENLHNDIKDKYSLNNVTKTRRDLYIKLYESRNK